MPDQSTALEAALRMADALSGLHGGMQGRVAATAPTSKSLDEILARDRARIAAATQRNLNYVIEAEAASKAKAKATITM